MFEQLGTFVVTELQKELHKSGVSWQKWIQDYPMIFDEQDLENFKGQAKRGYLMYGSLTGIFIYNATGYIPVMGSYQFKNHEKKREIVRRIVSPETWALIESRGSTKSQVPDVFAYSPDKTDYFFCEAKGPNDKLRPSQEIYFKELEKVSGKPVYIVTYKLAAFGKK